MTNPGICGSCPYFHRVSETAGVCRRYPPVPMIGAQARPTVKQDEWCGEHPARAGEVHAGRPFPLKVVPTSEDKAARQRKRA